MTDKLKWAGIAIVIGAIIGFVVREYTLTPKVVTITQTVNIDSLKNVWLSARKDSVRIDTLLRRIPAPYAVHDTVVIGDTLVLVYSTPFDSALGVSVTAVSGEDTTNIETTTRLSVDLEFYAEPLNLFNISRLSLSPIYLEVPHTEKVIDKTNDFGFWLVGGSRATTGVNLTYGKWGVGYERHFADEVNEVKFSWRPF
jgi:hypothetical protein